MLESQFLALAVGLCGLLQVVELHSLSFSFNFDGIHDKVLQGGLVLAVYLKMALNSQYACLCLPVAGITGVKDHIWRQAVLGIKLRASCVVNKLSTN